MVTSKRIFLDFDRMFEECLSWTKSGQKYRNEIKSIEKLKLGTLEKSRVDRVQEKNHPVNSDK